MSFANDLSFIARFAAARLSEVPHEERAQVLSSLATVFRTAGNQTEAEQCSHAADAIRRADGAQLVLVEMLEETK